MTGPVALPARRQIHAADMSGSSCRRCDARELLRPEGEPWRAGQGQRWSCRTLLELATDRRKLVVVCPSLDPGVVGRLAWSGGVRAMGGFQAFHCIRQAARVGPPTQPPAAARVRRKSLNAPAGPGRSPSLSPAACSGDLRVRLPDASGYDYDKDASSRLTVGSAKISYLAKAFRIRGQILGRSG